MSITPTQARKSYTSSVTTASAPPTPQLSRSVECLHPLLTRVAESARAEATASRLTTGLNRANQVGQLGPMTGPYFVPLVSVKEGDGRQLAVPALGARAGEAERAAGPGRVLHGPDGRQRAGVPVAQRPGVGGAGAGVARQGGLDRPPRVRRQDGQGGAGGRRGGDADQPAAAAGREGAEPEGVSGAVAERERPEGEGAGEGEEGPDPARAGAARGRRDQADEAPSPPQPLSPEGRGRKLRLTASAAPSAPRRTPPRRACRRRPCRSASPSP